MSEENDYAPAWRPEAGDEVEGKVVQVDARENEWGVYPILTLEDEGASQVAVHCIHSVLRREIARNFDPAAIVGQNIKIKYQGKGVVQGGKFAGKEFHNYKVFGGSRAYDWSKDLPQDGERSAGAWSAAGSSDRATAEPPIAPSSPEDFGPLRAEEKPPEPSRESAESRYGAEAPF